MEKEKKEVPQPRVKRKVSLFKKRKRADIRPFVKEKKHSNYKKTLSRIFFCVVILFFLAALLYGVRQLLLPMFSSKNIKIINPQGSIIDQAQVKNIFNDHGFDIDTLKFSTSSAVATFTYNKKTFVYISLEKDIVSQLDLIEAIDRQVSEDNKQAISIDLRYNKPIVKF